MEYVRLSRLSTTTTNANSYCYSNSQANDNNNVILFANNDTGDFNQRQEWLQDQDAQPPIQLEGGDGGILLGPNGVPLQLHEFPVFTLPKSNSFMHKGRYLEKQGTLARTCPLSWPWPRTTATIEQRWVPVPNKLNTKINIWCQVCGKGFCNKLSAGRHMATAHGCSLQTLAEKPLLKPTPPSANQIKSMSVIGQVVNLAPSPSISLNGKGITPKTNAPGNWQQQNQKPTGNSQGYQGEEPCFLCGLVFSTASQLMMHEKVHAANNASFNEPVPAEVEVEGAAEDEPVGEEEELKKNVIHLVGNENSDDDDVVEHPEEVQPMEMESNNIAESKCSISEPSHPDSHDGGRGCSRKPTHLPKPKAPQATGVGPASMTHVGQKMKQKNEYSTVKAPAPTVVSQDEIKQKDQDTVTQERQREPRLRPNPKRKSLDEYETNMKPASVYHGTMKGIPAILSYKFGLGCDQGQSYRNSRLRKNPKKKWLDDEYVTDMWPKPDLKKAMKNKKPCPKPKFNKSI